MSAIGAGVCLSLMYAVGRQNVHMFVVAWTSYGEANVILEPAHPISDTSTIGVVWPREHAKDFAEHVETAKSRSKWTTVDILIEQWQQTRKIRDFVSRPALLDHTGIISSLGSKRVAHMQSTLRARLRKTKFSQDFVDDQEVHGAT